ncbi:MAG: DEAD/DEAH box helicase, partial [bacterium]
MNNLADYFNKIRLNIANKRVLCKNVDIFLFDRVDLYLNEAHISQIYVPSIPPPQITINFCLPESEFVELGVNMPHIEKDFIQDFTSQIEGLLICPTIEVFSVVLGESKVEGKAYSQYEEENLFSLKDSQERCIHGLKKGLCSTCIEIERQKREKDKSYPNILDLILPILQPPLGEDFDSPIAFPAGNNLYPFQRGGVKFLIEHRRALLGDEMGLGKSIQTITAIRFLIRSGQIRRSLIICPKSVLTDWQKKLQVWAPELRVIKIHGAKEQRQIIWNIPSHIYLTTYETLRQDLDEIFSNNHFDLTVLDEVQKIKNPSTSIARTIRKIDSDWRWGLSGTPLENHLKELKAIFDYLKPGLLTYDKLIDISIVKDTIKPYFLRRRKSDVLLELPEKIYQEVWLDLSPPQREAYDRALEEGIIELNEKGEYITVQHILALVTKLKQICNLDPKTKESCKIDYLQEKLEEIVEQGDKVLIFSQYPSKTLEFLESSFKNFNPLIYHGSLSDSQRDEIIKKFQEEEKNKVLFMSVKAGALGLTLTRANYVFHYDLWWNPSVANQAED